MRNIFNRKLLRTNCEFQPAQFPNWASKPIEGTICKAVESYLDRRCTWLQESSRVQKKRSLTIAEAALRTIGVTEVDQITPATARQLVQMLSTSEENGGAGYATNTVHRILTDFARAIKPLGRGGQRGSADLREVSLDAKEPSQVVKETLDHNEERIRLLTRYSAMQAMPIILAIGHQLPLKSKRTNFANRSLNWFGGRLMMVMETSKITVECSTTKWRSLCSKGTNSQTARRTCTSWR